MIHRINEAVLNDYETFDVFGKNGDYLGWCYCKDNVWYEDSTGAAICSTEGTYYSDDHDDWLRMIHGLIEIQEGK